MVLRGQLRGRVGRRPIHFVRPRSTPGPSSFRRQPAFLTTYQPKQALRPPCISSQPPVTGGQEGMGKRATQPVVSESRPGGGCAVDQMGPAGLEKTVVVLRSTPSIPNRNAMIRGKCLDGNCLSPLQPTFSAGRIGPLLSQRDARESVARISSILNGYSRPCRLYCGPSCRRDPDEAFLIALLLVDDVEQRQVLGKAPDVFFDCPQHAAAIKIRPTGDVRRDDGVVELPQSVTLG